MIDRPKNANTQGEILDLFQLFYRAIRPTLGRHLLGCLRMLLTYQFFRANCEEILTV